MSDKLAGRIGREAMDWAGSVAALLVAVFVPAVIVSADAHIV
jgi:hypothetical protein